MDSLWIRGTRWFPKRDASTNIMDRVLHNSVSRVLLKLRCLDKDEVFISGSITGEPVPPFACKFCPDGQRGNLLALVDEEGSVKLLNSEQRTESALVKEWQAHKNAIFDVSWAGNDKLVTGSGDRCLMLWDAVGGRSLNKFAGHQASVKSVDVKQDEPCMFVSGSRDGSILVWDTRCSVKGSFNKPVNCIRMAHKKISHSPVVKRRSSKGLSRSSGRTKLSQELSSQQQYGVTAVLFHQDNKLASAGAADGVVKMWDLRRTYSNLTCEPPPCWHTFSSTEDNGRIFGFTSLISNPYQSSLYANCTDDVIYVYDSITLKKNPVKVFGGHKNSTFYVKACLSPEGRYLISGSSCGNAYIWDTEQEEVTPSLLLTGHTKEVTAVAWSPYQFDKVVTCADSCDIRIWRPSCTDISAGHSYIGFAESYTQHKRQDHLKASKVSSSSRAQAEQDTPAKKPLSSIENTISSPTTKMSLEDLLTQLPSSLNTDNTLIKPLQASLQDCSPPKRTKMSILAFSSTKNLPHRQTNLSKEDSTTPTTCILVDQSQEVTPKKSKQRPVKRKSSQITSSHAKRRVKDCEVNSVITINC